MRTGNKMKQQEDPSDSWGRSVAGRNRLLERCPPATRVSPRFRCPKQPLGALRLPMAWAIRRSGEPAYALHPPVVLPPDPANRLRLPFQRVEVVRIATPGGGPAPSSAEAGSVPMGLRPKPSSPPVPLRRPPPRFLRSRLRRAVIRFPGSPVPVSVASETEVSGASVSPARSAATPRFLWALLRGPRRCGR